MNLTQKQKILFVCVIVAITIGILFYIWKSSSQVSSLEVDLQGNIMENEPSEEANITEEESSITTPQTIIVHIAGEVVSEGIVTLKEGSRIADAISFAGGTTLEADLSDVNLAYILEDGQKVYIPNIHDKKEEDSYPTQEIISTGSSNHSSSSLETSPSMININTATQTQLETIPGIGPSTALQILQYRRENGPFQSIDELENVKGIGPAKLEKMRPFITV